MVQLKSLAFTSAAYFLLGAQAGPCNTCSPANIIQDSGFESGTTPWQFTANVQIDANTPNAELAHSGQHYVSIDVENRETTERYSISQQLSGLKSNQPYTLTYYYATTDNSGVFDGGVDIIVYLDGQRADYYGVWGRGDLNVWAARTVVIVPTSENPILTISLGGSGNYYYGATMIFDDISLGRACVANN